MYKEINLNDFRQEFKDYNRDYFSFKGYEVLFNYLEELEVTGNKLDVIAICCEFSECDIEELKTDYSDIYNNVLESVDSSVYIDKEEENEDIINCFIESLSQETIVLEVEKNKNYIIHNF